MTRTAISRPLIPAACLVLLLGTLQAPAQASVLTPFPPGGEYAGETMLYRLANFFIELQNPVLSYGGVTASPGAGPGDVDYNVSLFLSATMCVMGSCGPSGASGPAMVRALAQPDGSFDTEMLSMDLVGGPNPFGPGPMMIRESPTLASLGRTMAGGGPLAIDSFFDIFTEISFDGNLWTPVMDTDGTHFTLREFQEPSQIPEPATLLLVGTGFAVMARSVRRRSRKA